MLQWVARDSPICFQRHNGLVNCCRVLEHPLALEDSIAAEK